MRNVTTDYGKKTENAENERKTLQDLEYGEQHLKNWKIRNAKL